MPSNSVQPRILLSIHEVSPRFEREVIGLHAQLSAHVGSDRMAMLVVPNHHRQGQIVPGSPFAARLRAWSDAGVEMFVQGWTHKDGRRHRSGWARWKARHLTGREGEFLGLNQREAARRMADGRALIEDITGRPTMGFVAPAWGYGPGALAALPQSGLALAEDQSRIWDTGSGAVLARAPVISWANRGATRIRSSLIFARAAGPLLTPWPVIRLAVHPGDFHVPALTASIDRTLDWLLRHRDVARYADLCPAREEAGSMMASYPACDSR